MDMFSKIDQLALSNFDKEIREKLITGIDPFIETSNPFKSVDECEIIPEILTNPVEIYSGLMKILKSTCQKSGYILYYGVYFSIPPEITFQNGFMFSSEISKKDFANNLDKNDLGIQGDACCYFDKTFTWCIFQTYGVRLIMGNEKIIETYFENENRKIEEIDDFMEEIQDPDFLKSHSHMKKHLKYKIKDKWFTERTLI